MKKFRIKVLKQVSWILFLVFITSCGKSEIPVEKKPVTPPIEVPDPDLGNYTSLTKKLVETKTLISTVITDVTFVVTPGVEETDIRYANKEGKAMQLFILKIDLNNPNLSMEVGTPFNKPEFSKQTVLNMAKGVDAAGHKIVAGINGDFYNTTTLIPVGILHKNSQVIKNTFSDNTSVPQQGLSFFAILNDGKPYIGYKSDYSTISPQIKQATGGGIVFLKDGKVITQSILNIDPRTAIGYTADGFVYIIVADGRNPAYSNGLTYAEMSTMMKAFDVKDALNLDGGGSSTFMIRNPASTSMEVRNSPSDGTQREVSNAWLVVSKSL
ncbi:phosphodiester glycosidase family protein [Pedobacter sp. ASV1-7]|uniref:phosphodiester glycosidase family protein n=1 Tax=Pedobacter sp. ASV1-7 TaxID=3145237 RepID=UPI0032E87DDA